MTPCRRTILPLLAVLALWGCAEDGSLLPDVGDGIEPTLASLQANVFTPYCSGCHYPGGTGLMPLDSQEASYTNLVSVGYSFQCGVPRVTPGDPEQSCIVYKIEYRNNYSGSGMPPTGQLSQDKIDAIRQWILDGALP